METGNRVVLYKLGGINLNSWQKRYFESDNEYLFYYKSSKDSQPKGGIKLDGILKVVPISYGEFKVRYCFGIVTETRTFYLHTQSQQSFDYWINFLGKQKAKTTPPVSPRSRNEESSYQGKQQEMKQETANLNVQPAEPPRKPPKPLPNVPTSSAPPPIPPRKNNSHISGIATNQDYQTNYDYEIPAIVTQCINCIESFGPSQLEGIYRESANSVQLKAFKRDYDEGKPLYLESCRDPHTIAGLLKLFFRESCRIIPAHSYQHFSVVEQYDNEGDSFECLKEVLATLPPTEKAILQTLIYHLKRITENSSLNKMTASNLAICWSPTLFGNSSMTGILQLMIKYGYDVF